MKTESGLEPELGPPPDLAFAGDHLPDEIQRLIALASETPALALQSEGIIEELLEKAHKQGGITLYNERLADIRERYEAEAHMVVKRRRLRTIVSVVKETASLIVTIVPAVLALHLG